MSTFDYSRAVQVLLAESDVFRKSIFFLNEEATRLQQGFGVLGGQVPGLYGGTTAWRVCDTLKGFQQGIENKGSIF